MTAHDPAADSTEPYDAVVLAGGAARRLGGRDKPGVRVGGRRLLDRVLAACAAARTTVVVAAPRPTARPVRWAREEPPGGGPVAALDAGLRHVTTRYAVVLSADLPFVEVSTVRRLLAALDATGTDGALLTDAEGRDQPLVAVYRTDALRRALTELAAPAAGSTGTPGHGPGARPGAAPEAGRTGQEPGTGAEDRPAPTAERPATPAATTGTGASGTGASGFEVSGAGKSAGDGGTGPRAGLAGLSLRRLTGALDLTRVPDPVASFDCDTWDDIATARARIREHGHVLDEWISAVKDELGIDLDVDLRLLLDLARDAAHGVDRPAAPLTTFLVGYAAARGEGGPEAVAEAARKAAALALRWEKEHADAPEPGKHGTGDGHGTGTGHGTGRQQSGKHDSAPDA